MRRGMYRTHGVDGLPDGVRVDDEGIDIPMEEVSYRARGYLPLVDDLPWQDDYFDRKVLASSENSEAAKAAREEARQEFRARFGKS